MPKGVLLTPDEIGEAARIFSETANYSETARRLNLPESTVRKALRRVSNPNRSELHARACATSERIGRRALGRQIKRLDRYLVQAVDRPLELNLPVEIEPLEQAALEGRLSVAVKTAADLADALDKRRTTRISRARTRAETEKARAETALFAKKLQGGRTPEDILRDLSAEELLGLLATLRARETASGTRPTDAPSDPPPPPGAQPSARE